MSNDKVQTEKDEKLKLLTEELESVKLVAAYMETQREEELAYLKKRHEEEISSLQHIVREANQQNNQNVSSNNLHNFRQPPSNLHLFDTNILNTSSNSPDKDRLMTKVMSVLQKRSPQLEGEDLEISQIKAKEHADMLRSIVTPFEEEIADLNRQLIFYKSQYERKNLFSASSRHDYDSSDSEPSDVQLIDLSSSQPESTDALRLIHSSASTSCLANNSRQQICISCQRLTTKCDLLESEITKLRKQVSRLQNELTDRDQKVEEEMNREVEKSNLEVNHLKQMLTNLTSILTDSQKLLETLKINSQT